MIPCALGASAPGPASAIAGPATAAATNIDPLLARADLARYRGWLKFLRYEATTAAARSGPESEPAREKARRLAEWASRIERDPDVLAKLTGVQEWAYESAADDSGQPFKIVIPSDYDPARPAGMSVYMHGWSGNHLEHSQGFAPQPGMFLVAVLGRGRGGGYVALSEADVLDVIGYIEAHWSIDRDRIHLNGGSMGGGGTYRLGSRYPQRWASGRPTCGYASFVPIANLLTYPIYATHSADDPVVSVLHDRGPLASLRELGGQVIYDETNGYGHAVWNYVEGNRRGEAWEKLQERPPARTVRHIDYTATDGGAVRGWWAEVAEWGDAPQPARFVVTAGNNNTLFAELTNIRRLRVAVGNSPFDRSQPLQVVVDGGLPLTFPAPLPDTIVVAKEAEKWGFETKPPELRFRLHTPGSAALLYAGQPLLIVYGTRGTDSENAAMLRAAQAAAKSPNPAWLGDGGEAGPDGVPHLQNLYGWMNIKADHDVTDADIARCHLVLIGTAGQNALVGRMADKLPVRFDAGKISCSDGLTFDGRGRALGLVTYDPLAPERLIFWVASNKAETYAPGAFVPLLMAGGGPLSTTTFGADLLVMDATRPTVLAARSFDSRWNWIAGRDRSRVVPAVFKTHRDLAGGVGAAIRRAAGADFALVTPLASPAEDAIVPGTTRVCDVLPFYYFGKIGVLRVSGTELLQIAAATKANPSGTLLFCPQGALDPAAVSPQRTYTVALTGAAAGALAPVLHPPPGTYRLTELSAGDAVGRFLGEE